MITKIRVDRGSLITRHVELIGESTATVDDGLRLCQFRSVATKS